jgi:hypothetical protein
MHRLAIFNRLVQYVANHTLSTGLGDGLLFGYVFGHVANNFAKIKRQPEIHVGAPDFH